MCYYLISSFLGMSSGMDAVGMDVETSETTKGATTNDPSIEKNKKNKGTIRLPRTDTETDEFTIAELQNRVKQNIIPKTPKKIMTGITKMHMDTFSG